VLAAVTFVGGSLLAGALSLTLLLSPNAPAPTTAPQNPAAERDTLLGALTHSLTEGSTGPRAPASAWFLYAADGDLWETDGEQTLQLTDEGDLSQPALDSEVLVYVKRGKNSTDLWLAQPDAPPRSLTRNAAAVVAASHWVAQPALLPGGAGVYVLADQNKAATGVGNLAIWQLDLQGGSPRQLTRPQAYTGGDQDIAVHPAEPSTIAFTRYTYLDSGQLLERVVWLAVSSGQALPLTTGDPPARQASIAPDGTALAFVQTHGRANDLCIGRLETEEQPRLVDVQPVALGTIAQPVWSPDGAQLAYLALTDRRFQLWVRPIARGADGTLVVGAPRQITHGDGLDATSRPVWLTSAMAAAVPRWLHADW
jgi:hypothetical protein